MATSRRTADTRPGDQPSPRERFAAIVVATGLAVAAALAVPAASQHSPTMGRVAIALTAAVATELLLTATLLATLARVTGATPVAYLATGFASAALVGAARAFAPPALADWFAVGGGAALAAAALGFAGATDPHVRIPRALRRLRIVAPAWLAVTALATAAAAAAAPLLPRLVLHGRPSLLLAECIGPLATLAPLLALAATIVATRLRTRIALWLAIELEVATIALPLGVANGEGSVGTALALAATIVGGGAFMWALAREHSATLRRSIDGHARIRALCLAATTRPAASDQIAALLALAIRDLGYEGAALCTLDGTELTVADRAGTRVEPVGERLRVRADLARRASRGELVVAEPAPGAPGVFVLVPLRIGATVAGALALVTRTPRRRWEATSDLDFVSLIGAFAASALARVVREERLDDLAFSDALTGLANRVALLERIEAARDDLRAHGRKFALHFLDLDGFKAINDRYGHAAGDRILQLVAERLSRAARATDTVARLGGDEFVILQRDVAPASVRAFAGRILDTFGERFDAADARHDVATSIGVALSGDPAESAADLLARADAALYRVKRSGRRGVAFAEARRAGEPEVRQLAAR